MHGKINVKYYITISVQSKLKKSLCLSPKSKVQSPKSKVQSLYLAAIAFIIFFACTKDESKDSLSNFNINDVHIEKRSNFEIYNASEFRPIILGEEMTNPYTLEIVNQANSLLYNYVETLVATHNYIKFLPQDQDDLAELDDWSYTENIVTLDYPMHYEVLEMGDYYIDPEVSDSTLTYQYASVPVDVILPSVQYEKLEELYLDESNPFLFIKTYIMTGHQNKLSNIIKGGLPMSVMSSNIVDIDGDLICDLANPPPPPNCGDCRPVYIVEWLGGGDFDCRWECDCTPPRPPVLNGCGCPVPSNPRIPAGCVKVENDFADEEVKIVKVTVRNGFFMSDVEWTDRDGCWEMSREYGDFILVQVKFENFNLKVRDLSYWSSLRVLRDHTRAFPMPYNSTLIRYDAVADRRQWAASHTHNTDLDYRDRSTTDGIPQPRLRLNYTLLSGGGAASAPMLQGNPINSYLGMLLAFGWPNAVLGILSGDIKPDITNQYEDLEPASEFNAITHHELGHASHYSIEGEGYWFHYRNHIIHNFGYGTFPGFNIGSSPGRVALGEAVGNYTGNLYGNTGLGGENVDFIRNYIPVGLMFDLNDGGLGSQDEIVDPNDTTIRTFDNVEGFTPAMIFEALESTTDIDNYGESLRNLHLANTPTNPNDYDDLIRVYDVFN